ncbi:MAG: COX15/CtaA family protein [bacterium]|nr:COX15/CtaA family protein [bacterium]
MQNEQVRDSRSLFASLALTTALLTIGLIVFGAVVRVTDSGLGCGNDWPLCDGRIIPPLDNLTAWIEWLHRLFAALIGLFGLATLVAALRAYRTQNRFVLTATVVAAGLFVLQSALGAFVVLFDLPPTMVTMHLGTAMLLLGALLCGVVGSRYIPQQTYTRNHVTLLVYATTALSLVIILTGALVRGSGATLACLDWPLCNGEIFPFQQGTLQTVHMMHRFAVGALGLTLLLLVWYVWQERRENRVSRALAVGALIVYLMQALVGALFVLTEAAAIWGAAHVGLAATTWGLLVALSVVETLNIQERGAVPLTYSTSAT